VRFIAINDSYDSENQNPQTDNLIIPFKNLINDAYCADTSRKIRSQFDIKRKKGEFIGAFTAYGYLKDPENKNRIIIDEAAASVIHDIFRMKIEGMSRQGISDRLNELGILSPLEYKKSLGCNYTTVFNTKHTALWTPVAVGRILKNELYIGVLTQGISTTPNYKVKERVQKSKNDWIRIEDSHEPIISKEEFALVSSLLKKDTRIAPGKDSVYVFSGMLRCAGCGKNLVRKYMYDRGNKYTYHVCTTHKKGLGCKSHIISDKNLNEAILETLRFHIRDCVRINRILELIEDMPFQKAETVKLQKLIEDKQAEIEKINYRRIKLYNDFCDNILSRNDYISFKEIFEMQSEYCDNALEKLQYEYDNIINNKNEKCTWIESFKKYQDIDSLTRDIVAQLIDSITVFVGGKIEVHFRYQSHFDNALSYIKSVSEDNTPPERLGV
jgi:hypothetical protein